MSRRIKFSEAASIRQQSGRLMPVNGWWPDIQSLREWELGTGNANQIMATFCPLCCSSTRALLRFFFVCGATRGLFVFLFFVPCPLQVKVIVVVGWWYFIATYLPSISSRLRPMNGNKMTAFWVTWQDVKGRRERRRKWRRDNNNGFSTLSLMVHICG